MECSQQIWDLLTAVYKFWFPMYRCKYVYIYIIVLVLKPDKKNGIHAIRNHFLAKNTFQPRMRSFLEVGGATLFTV